MEVTTAKPLLVDNENNKKACNVFSVIHFAPPLIDIAPPNGVMQLKHGPMIGNHYVIDTDNGTSIVELVHYEMMLMVEIESIHTLLASGLMYDEWKKRFIAKYPDTNHLTKMAVYCYKYI